VAKSRRKSFVLIVFNQGYPKNKIPDSRISVGDYYHWVKVAVGVGVGVAVAVGAALVLPVVAVADPEAPPMTITTVRLSPKNTPAAVDRRQVPWIVPFLFEGAVIATESCVTLPVLTGWARVNVCPPIASPPISANLNPASHTHDPLFCTSHVFVNVCPGVMGVLSGMVTSRM
jgi:hypothetical protein